MLFPPCSFRDNERAVGGYFSWNWSDRELLEGVATSHVKLGGVKTLHFFPHPKQFQFLQGKNFRMFRRTPFEMTVAIQILQWRSRSKERRRKSS